MKNELIATISISNPDESPARTNIYWDDDRSELVTGLDLGDDETTRYPCYDIAQAISITKALYHSKEWDLQFAAGMV